MPPLSGASGINTEKTSQKLLKHKLCHLDTVICYIITKTKHITNHPLIYISTVVNIWSGSKPFIKVIHGFWRILVLVLG